MNISLKRITYGVIGFALVLCLTASASAQNVFQGEIIANSGVTIEGGNLNLQGNVVDFNQGRSKIYDNGEMHIATDDKLYLDAQSVFIRNYLRFFGDDGADTSSISRDRDGRFQIITDEMLVLHSPHTRVSDDLYVGHWDESITNTGFVMDGNDFYVHGNAGVRGNIYTNNCVITGSTSSYCDGSITSSGPLTIDSDLEVTGDTSLAQDLDVGGDTALAGNLDVAGDGTFGGTLDVAGATHLMDTLEVDGATTLNDTLEVLGATLLDDTLEVVGSTTLDDTLDVAGATHLMDTLEVDGATTLNSTLDVADDAVFGENVDIDDDLTVGGDAQIDDELNVDGDATFNGESTFDDDVTMNEDLDVLDDVSVGGDLGVTGTTTLDGATTVNDNLEVNGDTDLNGTLDVTGNATFDADVSVGDDLTVTDDTIIGDMLTVTGVTNLLSDLNVTGPVSLLDTLDVSGNTTIGGTLEVTDTTTLNGLVTINDDLDVTGNTTVGGNLDVTGDTTFTGTVTYSGTLVVTSLDLTTPLAVEDGGTGNSSLTTNGVLYGNGTDPILATSAPTAGQVLLGNGSGVPTFTTVSGDVLISSSGVTTIQPNSVALGTDTTGDYVAGASGGNGIAVTGSGGEGSTPSFALGPLTSNWDQTGAFDIVLNHASSELRILESTGGTYYGTLDVTDLVADRTYTLPNESGTICTTGSVCSGYAPSTGSTVYATRELDNLTTTAINADLLPDTDDTYDLGSDTARWQDIYLGPSTMHIGTSSTDEATFSYNTSTNVFDITTDSTTNGDIAFFTNDLYLDKSTGYVGISTTTPRTYLDVETVAQISNTGASIGSSGELRLYHSQAGSALGSGVDIGQISFMGDRGDSTQGLGAAITTVTDGAWSTSSTPGELRFFSTPVSSTSEVQRMVIDSDGEIGIGTGSPSQLLHVSNSTNGNTQIHVQNASSGASAAAVLSAASDGAQGALVAHSTTFPTFADGVAVKAETSASGGLSLVSENASGNIRFYTGGTNYRGMWDASGNLGVGLTPGGLYQLEVSGDIGVTGAGDLYDTAVPASVSATTLCVGGSGQIGTCTSDARLKTNVQQITGALDVINNLNPVNFDFINGNSGQSGFLAQEVQQILPGLVTKNTGDKYLSLSYDGILGYAVGAIQELDKEVSNLKLDVVDVTDEVKSLAIVVADIKAEILELDSRITSLEDKSGTIVEAPATYPAKTDLPVSEGAAETTINWTDPVITDKYSVFITPTWDTNFWISDKNSTSFTVNFGNPAPAGAHLDYKVEIQK